MIHPQPEQPDPAGLNRQSPRELRMGEWLRHENSPDHRAIIDKP
jgi:hypothetical protein